MFALNQGRSLYHCRCCVSVKAKTELLRSLVKQSSFRPKLRQSTQWQSDSESLPRPRFVPSFPLALPRSSCHNNHGHVQLTLSKTKFPKELALITHEPSFTKRPKCFHRYHLSDLYNLVF